MPKLPHMPDFLYPTGDGKNRDEYFLVEFDDVLHSSMEAVVYGLLMLPNDRVNFPSIDEMDVINPEELYYALALLDPYEFLMASRKDESLTEEYVRDVIQRAHQINTWAMRSKLMVMYALVNLASAKYVKRIDICNVRSFEMFELEHMMTIFGQHNVKLNFFQGTISSLMKDKPEYTTVFMRSTPELFEIAKNPEEYHLDKTVLLLRNSSENVQFEQSTDGKLHPKELYNDEIRKMCEGKPWKIGRFSSTLFDPPPNYSQERW